MQMTILQCSITIALVALATAITRFAPFLLLQNGNVPAWLRYLGKVLPCAVMALLVVYCLKDINFTAAANFVPQAICVAVVAVLHAWRKQTLLSIGVGTALYWVLLHTVFA